MTLAEIYRREAEEKYMTLAETLRQEGMQKGMLLGKHEALEMFARNLLKHNESIEKIALLTGLSVSEIEKLKEKHL